jgi:drug/metabolite transporter (DMT)-like permease
MTELTVALRKPLVERREILGIALVSLSAASIAIVPTLAKLAYDGGSNTMTVITVRSLLSVALTFAVMRGFGHALRIGRGPMLISIASGVAYAANLVGFLGAVAYIPVNTVVLICFLHPLLVGLAGGRLGEAQGLKRTMGGMLVAFAGLALAIGFSFDKLNMAGVALAGLSMIACAAVIVGSGHAAKQAGSLAVVFYMMLSAAMTLALLFPFAGTWALPLNTSGWLGLSGVAIGATIGTLAFFGGLTLIGTVRATMLSNLEPVLGILFAMLVLGERIVALQGLGIALVIGAIVALEFRR